MSTRRPKPSVLLVAASAGLLTACAGEVSWVPGAGAPSVLGPGAPTGSGPSPGAPGVGGGAGGGQSAATPPAELPQYEPAPLRMRQLLSWQYQNAVLDLLGPEAAQVVTPPADVAVNGLSAIGASQLALSTAAISAYEDSALAAAKAALAVSTRKAQLIPCTPTGPGDDACMAQVIDRFGRRAFRRPLEAAERATWLKVGHAAAAAYGDFTKGVEWVVAGLLQSPQFLYRAEQGVADPAHPGWVRLTGYEVASRLSFFLAGSTPTDELLDQASNGTLDTPAGVKAAAEQLLARASSRQALWHFFDEMLTTDALPDVSKDSSVYPAFNGSVASSMREEARLFIEQVAFTDQADARQLLESNATWVDAKLAPLYGVPAPSSGFAKVTLPANQPRAGLLGQLAFLALQAHPASTSPTLRGKFIRERLLCETVAAPPPNVSTALPDPPAGQQPLTMRAKLEAHMSAPACKGCHSLMDPIGLGFESFDALGQFRTVEAGQPIDASGTLDGQAFADAKGLAAVIRADARFTRCLSKGLYRQALGHVELQSEARAVAGVEDAFANSGYKLQSLMVAIAQSDAFVLGVPAAGVTP